MEQKIMDLIDVLEQLRDDSTVPKNIRMKIDEIIGYLREDSELSIRINKALNILDEISDDNNIQAYTRTQIWNIASMLESF